MNTVIVAIPLYKIRLSEDERLSLTQCFRILRNYVICIVCSKDLDKYFIRDFAKQSGVEVIFEEFEQSYFLDIVGYNRLLLSIAFYDRFKKFKFILIYQTDSFVFRDDLSKWCQKNYDYIGAPWININIKGWITKSGLYPSSLKYFHNLFNYRLLKKVGNGGFSLRKTKSFIHNLTFFKEAAKTWKGNEDNFFSHYIGTFNPFFRIPNVKEALQFSFDAFPEVAFNLNQNRIPFGCHAWYRSEGEFYSNNNIFWVPFIQKFKDSSLLSSINNKDELL